MDKDNLLKRIKTCEAKYDPNKTVTYVVYSTSNGLFLGIVVYLCSQLKNARANGTMDVIHFSAVTEKEVIDECENWIKGNINSQVSISCK